MNESGGSRGRSRSRDKMRLLDDVGDQDNNIDKKSKKSRSSSSSSKRNKESKTKSKMNILTMKTSSSSSSSNNNSTILKYDDGTKQFRLRIICSLLSQKTLLIRNIRSNHLANPGLTDYEISYLRLIDKMTNGTQIIINNTGTQLKFVPGILLGGTNIQHDCPVGPPPTSSSSDETSTATNTTRSIGWYLEGIIPLGPFGKDNLSVTLTGITDGCCDVDPSPDYLKLSVIPIMEHFGIGLDSEEDGNVKPSIQILSRAAIGPKDYNDDPIKENLGKVVFTCPIIRKELHPIDITDVGKIKRIRGTAISNKIVSSSMAARVAYSAKGIFHKLLPDVWIHTDVNTPKKKKSRIGGCGINPSLSLIVSSQSTTGIVMTAECCMKTNTSEGGRGSELAEDLGQRGACLLLEE